MKRNREGKGLNASHVLPIIFSGLASVLGFLTTIFIAKPLGTELYGEIQYYVGVITTLASILSFGLPAYLDKQAQYFQDEKKSFSQIVFIFNFLSFFVAPIFVIIAVFCLKRLQNQYLLTIFLFVAAFIQAFSTLFSEFLLGRRRLALSSFLGSLLPKILLFSFSIALILLNMYSQLKDWYVYFYIAAYALSSLPFIFRYFSFRKPSLKEHKEEAKSVIVFYLLTLTQGIYDSLTKVIQGEYSTNSTFLAVVSLSLQLASVSQVFTRVIDNMAKPDFAKFAKENDFAALMQAFREKIRIGACVSVPLNVAFIVEAQKVLNLFGAGYASLPLVLVIVGIDVLINAVTGPSGTILNMCGHEKLQLINGVVNFLIYLGFGFLFLYFTEYGIILSTLMASILINVVKLIEMKLIYKIHPFDWKTTVFLFVTIVLSGGVFFGLNYIEKTWIWLLANCLVGLSLIVLFVFVSPYKSDRLFFVGKKTKSSSK